MTAEKVVVCTNGYTGDLVPRLRQTVIAPNSFQIATAAALRQHPQIDPALRPGLLRHPQAAALLPPRPRRPLHHGRARPVPRAAKRRRLGPSRARRRQDVPAAQRRADRASLVRPGRAHPRFPAAPARARARPPRRHRLHGPRRRPADRDGAEAWPSTSRPATGARCRSRSSRSAAALPPAAQGLRLGDHRLVPDDGWRREAAA